MIGRPLRGAKVEARVEVVLRPNAPVDGSRSLPVSQNRRSRHLGSRNSGGRNLEQHIRGERNMEEGNLGSNPDQSPVAHGRPSRSERTRV